MKSIKATAVKALTAVMVFAGAVSATTETVTIPTVDLTGLGTLIEGFVGIIPGVLYALIPVAIAIVVLGVIYKMGSFVNKLLDKAVDAPFKGK